MDKIQQTANSNICKSGVKINVYNIGPMRKENKLITDLPLSRFYTKFPRVF